MHKNCCHQSCSFWLRYAPNRLSAGASPQTPLVEFTALPQTPSWFSGGAPGEREGGRGGERKKGRGREGEGGEGVPECPNPELASLIGLPTVSEWPGSSRNRPMMSCVPGEAHFVPEMWKLTTGHGYMAVNKCHDKLQQNCQSTKQSCYTRLTNLCIKLQNVISMISFRGTSSPD